MLDAAAGLVAESSYRWQVSARRIVEVPVCVALSWREPARVVAARGDDEVGLLDRTVVESTRLAAVMSMPSSTVTATATGLS